MSNEQELKIRNMSGQNSDVIVTRRRDGSVYVVFTSEPEYGYPSLEMSRVKWLLDKMEEMSK